MKRALKWVLAGIGITVASVLVFGFALWLFPGHPERFYLVVVLVSLSATLLLRLLAGRTG